MQLAEERIEKGRLKSSDVESVKGRDASHAADTGPTIDGDIAIRLTRKATRFNLASTSLNLNSRRRDRRGMWRLCEPPRAPTGRNFAATLSAHGLTIALTSKKFNDRVWKHTHASPPRAFHRRANYVNENFAKLRGHGEEEGEIYARSFTQGGGQSLDDIDRGKIATRRERFIRNRCN